MYFNHHSARNKFFFIFICVLFLIYIFCFYLEKKLDLKPKIFYSKVTSYLIKTNMCTIPDYQPFNEEVMEHYKREPYVACSKNELLTSIILKKNNTETFLKVDKEIGLSYTLSKIYCCISYIYQDDYQTDNVKYTECLEFSENEVKVKTNTPIYVKCYTKILLIFNYKVYENIHLPMAIISKSIQKRTKIKENPHLNVLIIGIDSVSRLNFIRSMIETQNFIESDQNWHTLNIYHKVKLNTFPNLSAMLTGLSEQQIWNDCNPTIEGGLDNCTFIWNLFDRNNYVTAYFEDSPAMQTFHYNKKGFLKSPTDHHGRLYTLACEKKLATSDVDWLTYCTGPETHGERIWNKVIEFTRLYQSNPYFGLFWMNSYSHSYLNTVSRFDHKVKQYMERIMELIGNKTIVFFLSDHGMRFGEYRHTLPGFMEDSLPFLHIYLPRWFRDVYKKEYDNLVINKNRLVTAFDIYMTLQNILELSTKDFKTEQSIGCPKCRSIFENINIDRSCKDVNIAHQYCTCYNYQYINLEEKVAQIGSTSIADSLNKKIIDFSYERLCSLYVVNSILKVYSFQDYKKIENGSNFLLMTIETKPKATFEAVIQINEESVLLTTVLSINRLDSYKSTGYCVEEASWKEICNCY